jgi:hypothetical protein
MMALSMAFLCWFARAAIVAGIWHEFLSGNSKKKGHSCQRRRTNQIYACCGSSWVPANGIGELLDQAIMRLLQYRNKARGLKIHLFKNFMFFKHLRLPYSVRSALAHSMLISWRERRLLALNLITLLL